MFLNHKEPRPLGAMFLTDGILIVIFVEGHPGTISAKLFLILTTGCFKFLIKVHKENWPRPLATMVLSDQNCLAIFVEGHQRRFRYLNYF